MIREAIDKILLLAPPNELKLGDLRYTDKPMTLLAGPRADTLQISTLQGLVDLYEANLDGTMDVADGILVHVLSPTAVRIISRDVDEYKRRRVWVEAQYPKACTAFPLAVWLTPENFVIAAQQGFQRVAIEGDDGTLAQDLDYVLKIASKISAEAVTDTDDDGIAQRVSMRQGVVLKGETTLRPIVNLAPYRTFAEIDQPLSQFVFRARFQNDAPLLALFDGDGGRWQLSAVAAIKAWLAPKFGGVPVVS